MSTQLDRLFARYSQLPNSCVSIIDQGSSYLIIVGGGSRRPNRSKAFVYSKEGTSVGGTRDRWVNTGDIGSQIEFYTPTIPTTPPPAPPSPEFDTITSSYNTTDGYGEVDLEQVLEDILNVDLPSQPDQALVEDNRIDNYGLDRIGAPEAWAAGYTGEGIIVAVLDTGVDTDHFDLDEKIWINEDEIAGDGIDNDNNGYIDDIKGWNAVDENNNVEDIDGHGTHVAGTIAAEENGVGIVGAAYGVRIMPVKVFDDEGSGAWTDIAQGIYYAVDNGANIINMSLGGGYTTVQIVEDAIRYANDNGVMCVMAAGNEGAPIPAAPGTYASEYGIVVGAVDENGALAGFSNRAGGPTDWDGDGAENPLYVTSSGVGIFSTLPDDFWGGKSGTSMATPFVAAAVAIMMQADPTLSLDQIRVALANNTK